MLMTIGKIHWAINPGAALNERLFGQRILDNTVKCKKCGKSLVVCLRCQTTTPYKGFGKYEARCINCDSELPGVKNVISAAIDKISETLTDSKLRLAVLGARRTGKTRILQLLSGKQPDDNYKQTLVPESISSHEILVRGSKIPVDRMIDLPGSEQSYPEWKVALDRSSVAMYLLRADRLIAGDLSIENRARNDMTHIGKWLECLQTKPRFFLVGTHCDLDPRFGELSEDTLGDYLDDFRRLPIMSELVMRAGGSERVKVAAGSLRHDLEWNSLLGNIFAQL